MSCESCMSKNAGENGPGPIQRYYFEGIQAKDERIIRRLIIALAICAVLIAACLGLCYKINRDCLEKVDSINRYWIDYISQYDFEDYTVDLSTDGGGNANYIGANGDIYNGASGSTQTDTETEGRQSARESDTP